MASSGPMDAPVTGAAAGAGTAPSSLGIGLGGAGYLLVYYIGVLEALQQLGIISRSSRTAGASGGSIAAVSFNSGFDLQRLFQYTADQSDRCCYCALYIC